MGSEMLNSIIIKLKILAAAAVFPVVTCSI